MLRPKHIADLNLYTYLKCYEKLLIMFPNYEVLWVISKIRFFEYVDKAISHNSWVESNKVNHLLLTNPYENKKAISLATVKHEAF